MEILVELIMNCYFWFLFFWVFRKFCVNTFLPFLAGPACTASDPCFLRDSLHRFPRSSMTSNRRNLRYEICILWYTHSGLGLRPDGAYTLVYLMKNVPFFNLTLFNTFLTLTLLTLFVWVCTLTLFVWILTSLYTFFEK